jgi:hypothetical protein
MELLNLETAVVTMSSLELVEFINAERGADVAQLRHDHFMTKVVEVLGVDAPKFLGTQTYGNNNTRSIYNLPKREACLMAMSYSYPLQAKVFDRMQELEAKLKPALPQTFAQALRLLAAAEELKEQQALKVENLSTALDVLVEWVSILKVAKHNKVHEKQFNWRKLKASSEALGFVIKRAESPRFGYQNLYHVAAFKACYPQFNYAFLEE